MFGFGFYSSVLAGVNCCVTYSFLVLSGGLTLVSFSWEISTGKQIVLLMYWKGKIVFLMDPFFTGMLELLIDFIGGCFDFDILMKNDVWAAFRSEELFGTFVALIC